MKRHILLLLVIIQIYCVQAQIPAFTGAEGGGMYTTGGRGGKVIYVTSLADTNTQGTLRWAVNQSGARTIVFNVSGIITLKSRLLIKNDDLTIAGQTAPGDGICIKDYEVAIDANNVIIRYMRFRLGDEVTTHEPDAFWGRYKKDIIIDHCSVSWSIDECASFYSNENFTMQWCIISESLNSSLHGKGNHGYGAIWGGKNASFHHNLLAHHNSRNPRFNGWKRSGLSYENPLDEELLDFRNNVIYNWGDNGAYGGESAGKYNIVANYYKYGAGTKSSIKSKITQIDIDANTINYPPGYGTYYIKDNYVYAYPAVTNDNWTGVTYANGVNKVLCRKETPFSTAPITQHTAELAFDRVLSYAGASLARDVIDQRVTNEARNGTTTYVGSSTKKAGIIDSQTDVGGWCDYNTINPIIDTDKDGIPDGWLDTNYQGKKATDKNEEGYTYLEVYLNSLVQAITINQNLGGESLVGIQPNESVSSLVKTYYDKQSQTLKLFTEYSLDKVQVYTFSGALLLNQICNNEKELFIPFQKYSNGIYIVRITMPDAQIVTLKVVV